MQPTEDFRKAIADAENYSGHEITLDSVFEGLANGTYQGWHIDSVFVVTSVIRYENFSSLRITHCGGNLTDELLKKALDILEEFAKTLGCSRVELYGRRGWCKRLKPYGYNELYTVVVKSLGGSSE